MSTYRIIGRQNYNDGSNLLVVWTVRKKPSRETAKIILDRYFSNIFVHYIDLVSIEKLAIKGIK